LPYRLRIHKPELYYCAELTEYEQSVIDMAIEVEHVARNLFPQGLLVPGSKTEAQQNTLKCRASNPGGILFQAVFHRDQMLGGLSGHGKTLFALNIVRCLLTCLKLFGYFVVPPASTKSTAVCSQRRQFRTS
jgi:hypothetical protein